MSSLIKLSLVLDKLLVEFLRKSDFLNDEFVTISGVLVNDGCFTSERSCLAQELVGHVVIT